MDAREKKKIKKAFTNVKEELSEHLDTINSNTHEIQSNTCYVQHLEKKIDKLTERVDYIYMCLSELLGKKDKEFYNACEEDFNILRLTKREQDFFLLIYDSDEKGYITIDRMSKMSGYGHDDIKTYISRLISKGIPITKKHTDSDIKIFLDPNFKELQTKKNILNISSKIFKKVRDNEY
jgi:hypothetical protein